MRFMTSWREGPSINYYRHVIRNTTAQILNSSIHYEQMQQPYDLATILEDGLFVDASSEDEYMNQETLIQRLLTQLDKLQGIKYSQQVACPIDNNKYGLLNTDMSHPTFLQEAVSMPTEFPSFGALTDMNVLPNYCVYGQSSNLNTGYQSSNSPFQLQHANDVEMDLRQYGNCLGSNQKNESMAFLTTMENSQQSESLNLLMPQNVSREISDVPNQFPNTNSNGQSSSVGNLWQDQHLKWDFLSDFKHLKHPSDDCINDSVIKTGSCFVDQGENCYPMLGSLKQTHLPTKNHYGDKQLLFVNNNLKSNKRDTYDSSAEFEGMLHPTKRVKKNPASGVSSINNSTYNLPAPEMVQPCIMEETSALNNEPVSPLDEVLQLYYMAQSSHPTQDSTSISESQNEIFICEGHKGTHVSEEPHSKSHQVITISNNSSAHTSCNDRGAITKNRTEIGKMVTNEVEERENEPEKETNSSNSTVYGVSLTDFLTCDQIREHIMSFGQHFGQTTTTVQEEISDYTCQLCGMDELTFAPLPIYCLTCGDRIKRNANYYCETAEEFDIDKCFCATCYKRSGGNPIAFKGTSISKTSFDRKKNDVIINEPWVQCDKCKRWQHQICALYNIATDMEGNSEYMCPMCCLNETENGMSEPLRKTNIFGAKDLPRTMLSEHIEQRLSKRLEQERADMAKIEGKNVDEVLVAEDLCVRVLSSSNQQLKVDKQFLDIFSTGNDPTELNYVTKAIFLFQKIEGVDVCLFSMYVQEFGSDCRHQNQRCIYISYLDSVKYLRPQRQAATGEALRTFIYHEILIGYLDYCKKQGFATCYIWSCPPTKGDDYILYCHPKTQKTPKKDHLRHWYHSMLRKASEENIAVGLTNMYDQFFDTSGKCDSKSKVTAARLPYFYGDYWSGAAIDIVKKIEETERNDVRKVKKRVLKKRTSEHTNPPKGSRDVQVMQELGKKISRNKEDFIIVQLQYACINCNEVIMSGKRWFCSECKIFQECERCHTADIHISSSGEKHTLCQVLVNDIPLHTKENDIILDNGLLDTRDKFLSFCQRNHFQFDTLRHAKHSSIMILHHLKNTTLLS